MQNRFRELEADDVSEDEETAFNPVSDQGQEVPKWSPHIQGCATLRDGQSEEEGGQAPRSGCANNLGEAIFEYADA